MLCRNPKEETKGVSKMENRKTQRKKVKKNKKPILSSGTKRTIGIVLTVLFFVVVVGGYFIYFAGVPAKILTGLEFHQIGEDGTDKTIDTITVNEINYYYSLVHNEYLQSGMIDYKTDVTTELFGDSGLTYRQVMMENAADNAKQTFIMYHAATEAGFQPEAADGIVSYAVSSIRTMANEYNLTADKYLVNMYGRGMTVGAYSDIIRKGFVAQEYESYLQQNEFKPTDEELESIYNTDPNAYQLATFQYYVVESVFAENATEIEIEQANQSAHDQAAAIIAQASDSDSFREACKVHAGPERAAYFADGNDPTIAVDYSAETAAQISPALAEFVYASDRQSGDAVVIDGDGGSVAVYYVSSRIDETETVAFRSLIIENDSAADVSLEDIQAGMQKAINTANKYMSEISDEDSFVTYVKKYSDDNASIASGGIVFGVTEADFATDTELDAYSQALYDWLFAEERMVGDMVVVEAQGFVSLLYFTDRSPAWKSALSEEIVNARYNQWTTSLENDGAITVIIKYGNIDFASY